MKKFEFNRTKKAESGNCIPSAHHYFVNVLLCRDNNMIIK